jgi:hypothetical protein
MVMRNVFSAKLKVHQKFDLKGSTVDRQASTKEKVHVHVQIHVYDIYNIHNVCTYVLTYNH